MAVEHRGKIMEKRNNALAVRKKAAEAREKMQGMTQGQTVADATERLAAVAAARINAEKEVAELKAQLLAAEAELKNWQTKEQSAKDAVEAAKQQANLTAAWEADIKAAESAELPTEAQIADAENAVAQAAAAIELGVKVRAAKKAKQEAERFSEDAKKHGKSADWLRGAAAQVFDVLTESIKRIPNCPLGVRIDDNGDARLVLATDRSETEPFDDLSDGEKWPIIIQLAAAKNRCIVLPQAAYGEIGEAMRAQIDALAKQHGCYILTAQVDEGELRAAPYSAAIPQAAAA
jgi:hypothetical protein